MGKHAYLILAHSDTALLSTLIDSLDDCRNDIYVHWDAKSGDVPVLSTNCSRLYVLDERVNVGWASYSMVEAEYKLLKKAYFNGPYSYYHFLSGADLPIKSQDYIHAECERLSGTEFIGYAKTPQSEIDFRVQHHFLFPEEFRTKNIFKRGLRFLALKCQDLFHYRRTDQIIKKGSQWCSITHSFVGYLLKKEEYVKELFDHTFCPDEMFIQTVAFNSEFAPKVKKTDSEYDGNLRFIKWENGELLPIGESDLDAMKNSDKWFARKFSGSDSALISKVLELSK